MPIFFTLSQANARRLQDVAGGDEARVNFLTTALGQQLVGRPGLTPTQQKLLQVCPQLDAQLSRHSNTYSSGSVTSLGYT